MDDDKKKQAHLALLDALQDTTFKDEEEIPLSPVDRVAHPSATDISQDTVSISSESQRKLRPESVLMPLTNDPLILAIALVDFDHAVCISLSLMTP